VDIEGLLLKVRVHRADIQDRDGGKHLAYSICCKFPGIKKFFVDGGYAGQFVEWVFCICKVLVEVVKRNAIKGFEVLPKRWIIERTFGWFTMYRRLCRHYEYKTENAEGMVYLASIRINLRKLSGTNMCHFRSG
jgi:putative transposase